MSRNLNLKKKLQMMTEIKMAMTEPKVKMRTARTIMPSTTKRKNMRMTTTMTRLTTDDLVSLPFTLCMSLHPKLCVTTFVVRGSTDG